jgi:hypothetical protein
MKSKIVIALIFFCLCFDLGYSIENVTDWWGNQTKSKITYNIFTGRKRVI